MHRLLLRKPFSHHQNIVLVLPLPSFLVPVIADTVGLVGVGGGTREGGGRVLLDHQHDSDRNSQDVQDGRLSGISTHILYKKWGKVPRSRTSAVIVVISLSSSRKSASGLSTTKNELFTHPLTRFLFSVPPPLIPP